MTRSCCLGSSMTAPSNSSTSTSRTTRIERSASWKTIWPTSDFSGPLLDHLVEAVQVGDLADEVLLLGALRGGADDHAALADVDLVDQLAEPGALAVGQALGDADAAALRHVDEVAARDRELHREARALGLQRVLDDLDDDLLAGLDQLVDPAAPAAAPLGHGLAVRAGRSRRRGGSRFAPGRCRRTPPPSRAGRCRPCPCRRCRRSSGGRGAPRRARRPSIRWLGQPSWGACPPWGCPSPRARRRGSHRGRR